jgi:sulfoxide reductase heme-binding subunit YedZ
MRKSRLAPLRLIVHTGAWIPLAWLAWAYLSGGLGVNPIQAAEQWTGRFAAVHLALSLACTPLNTLFGWHDTLKVRRALGLYAFMYAVVHLSILVGVDYGFAFDLLWADLADKPYILVGASALLILLALAVTSFKWWMRKLGQNWKRLHQLVYLAGPLVALHYAWAQKGDLFTLRGNIALPLVCGLIVALLLALRIPRVRRAVTALRGRLGRIPRPPLASPKGPLLAREGNRLRR